jgi:hypothetical protein
MIEFTLPQSTPISTKAGPSRTPKAVVGIAVITLFTLALPAAAQDLSTCNGESLRHFIGKPVKDMERVRTDKVRYVCEGCAMTMDFSPERLTVIYSEKTGLVKEMSCK